MEDACKTPGCTKEAETRGLCQQHYLAAWRAVQRGETSWAEMERLGLCEPSAQVGRPSKFRQVIEQARRKASGRK